MIKFSKNLAHLRKLKSLSQEAFADELDITRSRVSSYEEGRSEPPLELLAKMAKYFKLPIDAMVNHDLSKANDDTFIDIGNNRVLFPILITPENENLIEVVPIRASAGYLDGYSDPEYVSELPQMKLPFMPTGKHRAFPIKGDSMEPWVKEGAFIVGRFVEQLSEIKNGQTYIVVTQDDGLSYKRLYWDESTENSITLKSDNPVYAPYNILANQILELWEYTCKIDVQNYDNEQLNINSILQMMRSFQVELKEIKQHIKS